MTIQFGYNFIGEKTPKQKWYNEFQAEYKI